MKKKFLALLLTALMLLSLCACGGGSGNDAGTTPPPADAGTSGDANEPSEPAATGWTPSEPVNMIVAYKAGSGTDNTARETRINDTLATLSEELQKLKDRGRNGHIAVLPCF